jgi:hypothetical protein
MPLISMMVGAVVDGTRDVEPEIWRRYLAVVLRGLRAEPTMLEPLPVGPLTEEQVEAVMRCWHPPSRHR